VLVKLTNETVAASCQITIQFGFGCGIRKRSGNNSLVCTREVSMGMRGFNRRSVNDKTEQQN